MIRAILLSTLLCGAQCDAYFVEASPAPAEIYMADVVDGSIYSFGSLRSALSGAISVEVVDAESEHNRQSNRVDLETRLNMLAKQTERALSYIYLMTDAMNQLLFFAFVTITSIMLCTSCQRRIYIHRQPADSSDTVAVIVDSDELKK